MKISQGYIIEVPENEDTDYMWLVDAIPCTNDGITHLEMSVGEPTITEHFIRVVSCEHL